MASNDPAVIDLAAVEDQREKTDGAAVELKALGEEQDQSEKTDVSSNQIESRVATPPQKPQMPSFPEGGLQAWATVVGAFLIQYCSFGYIGAFGIYQDYYVREYLPSYSSSDIGWIGGMQIFLNFSMGIFAGRAFDRGYFYYLNAASVVLHALGLFMLSITKYDQYYQVFLTHGLVFGLSSGLTYVPSLFIVSHYFFRKRSLAIGIVASGSALGSVLHPIMLNHLFRNRNIGFHDGVRISAGLNVFLLLVALALMRTRLPPKPKQTFPVLEWAKQPAYVLHMLGGFFTFLGLFTPLFYLQLKAIKEGVDENISFYAISILNAASIFGRTIPNALSPKIGALNLLAAVTLCTGVITLTMSTVKTVAGVVLFGIFYGFFSGAAIALFPAIIPMVSKDMSEVGARLGIIFGILGFVGLFAQPIAGALLGDDYTWINATLFAGLTILAACAIQIVERFILAKARGTNIL